MRRRSLTLRHTAHGLGLGSGASPSPAEALGADHPLARTLDLIRVLLRQSLATSSVLVVSAVGVVLGADRARAPLLAAVAVQLVLAAVLAAVVALKRERARDLIIEGPDVWLPVLERERRRLLERRRREALASALEDLVRTAERWHRILLASRPLYNPLLVRQVGPELLAIASLLRSATIRVRGVARSERLLRNGTSPLFGTEIEELRAELAKIRTDLARSALPAGDVSNGHRSMTPGK
jgi:hypothetical protein